MNWRIATLFFWVASANAVEYPRPDVNGYISQYDEPFIKATDTCKPGRICHVLPTPKGQVSCAGGSAANPNASNEYIIRDNSGWSQINQATYTKYFVCPGNYTKAGQIVLTRSGTANTPRWIVWWSDTNYDLITHPARMQDGTTGNALGRDHQAKVEEFVLDGADYIYVDRLSFIPDGTDNDPHKNGITLDKNAPSTFNIFNRIVIEGEGISEDDGVDRSADAGIKILWGKNNDNIVQNSVIRNCRRISNSDTNAIISFGSDRNKLVNNEIYDCSQAFQLSGDERTRFNGWVIENNDMYFTPNIYADCNGKWPANKNVNGNCMCAESIWNIKSGSTDIASPVRLVHNRLWGNKRQAAGTTGNIDCGGSGQPSGNSGQLMYGARNVIINKNIFQEFQKGLIVGGNPSNKCDSNGTVGAGNISCVQNNQIASNIFYRGFRYDSTSNTDYAINDRGGYRSSWIFNTIIDTQNDSGWIWIAENDIETACNLIVNGGGAKVGNRIKKDFNTYVGNSVDIGENNKKTYSVAAANLKPYAYWRKLITSPQKIIIPNAAPTKASPFIGYCGNYSPLPAYGVGSR